MGIKILPPDINEENGFSAGDKCIRYGLTTIKMWVRQLLMA